MVLGGAGFVGSHVAEHYAGKGHRVRVVDNNSRNDLLHAGSGRLSNWDVVAGFPGVEVVEASILDADVLPDLLKGADAVVHTAAQTAVTVSVEDPRTDFLVNTVGTFNVLEAARKAAPTAPFVFCSTNKVYGGNVNALPLTKDERRYSLTGDFSLGIPETLPIDQCEHSPYGVSKTSADLYVQEYAHLYGLPTTVLRMSCIYGTRQWGVSDQGWIAWFGRAILDGSPITIYGDGYQARDLLYVADLVAAIDAALEHDGRGEVFNMGGGADNVCSLIEAIDLLEGLIGRKAKVSFAQWRPSDQRVYVSDIRKAKKELGWEPQVSPKEGIALLVDWLASA